MDKHSKNTAIESLPEHSRFEQFAGSVILETELGYDAESSVGDFMAGDGVQGYDLFATVVNGTLVPDVFALEEVMESSKVVTVEFIFAQMKTSSSYHLNDFSNFVDTCRMLIENHESHSSKEFPAIELISAVYDHADQFRKNPDLSMFYVTTSGVQPEAPILRKSDQIIRDVEAATITSKIRVECLGSPDLQRMWRQLDQGITRTIQFEKRVSIPTIEGVKQAYMGVLPSAEILRLVATEGGSSSIVKSVFHDNVRDYQGHIEVNSEIFDTLNGSESDRFAVFNNGVTVVAKEVVTTGDSFKVSDYQVVNGCQTLHVLHEAALKRGGIDSLPGVFVPVKVVATDDIEVARMIAQATNQQTQVSAESLLANSESQKRIEEFFNSIPEDDEFKLYYERRLKQWSSTPVRGAWRLITVRQMIRAFGATFLQLPHRANRYYVDLRDKAAESIFMDEVSPEFHWAAALLYCRFEFLFKNGKISADLKPIKFHIMAAIVRAYYSGRFNLKISPVMAEKNLSRLRAVVDDDDRLISAIEKCAALAEETSGSQFDRDFCKSQESAKAYINKASAALRSSNI